MAAAATVDNRDKIAHQIYIPGVTYALIPKPCVLNRSFVILTVLIKVLTSDNEFDDQSGLLSTCEMATRLASQSQDQKVTSPALEETSFCLQTVYLKSTLKAFYQLRSGFQPTRRRNFGLNNH